VKISKTRSLKLPRIVPFGYSSGTGVNVHLCYFLFVKRLFRLEVDSKNLRLGVAARAVLSFGVSAEFKASKDAPGRSKENLFSYRV